MALAKLQSQFSAIKGSIGGTIFQDYHGKTMLRSKHAKKEPAKTGGQVQRSRFASVRAGWSALTESERIAWSDAARFFPFTDKFGDQYTGSGYQLWMRCSLIRRAYGGTVDATVPVDNLSGVGGGGEEVEIIGMQDKSLNATWEDNGLLAANSMLLFASPPTSAARGYKPPRMALVAQQDARDQEIIDVQDKWATKFGYAMPTICTIWFMFRQVDPVNGFLGPETWQRLEVDLTDDPL